MTHQHDLNLQASYISPAATYSYEMITLSQDLPDERQLAVYLGVNTVAPTAGGNNLDVNSLAPALQHDIRTLNHSLYTVNTVAKTVTVPDPGGTIIPGYPQYTYLPYTPSAFEPLILRRSTDISRALVDFQPGSRLSSNQLNTSNTQLLNSIQEITSNLQSVDNSIPGAAATITVGTTTTGLPGSSATVVNSGTQSNAVFDFAIPQGSPNQADPIFDVKDYGAVGNGTTDDTAAFVAALTAAAGRTLTVSNGTYNITSLEYSGDANLQLDANAVITTATPGTTMMKLGGVVVATTTVITCANGATTLTLTDVTGVTVGSILRLRSDELYASVRTPTAGRLGELVRVKDVTGLVVTLESGIIDSYSSVDNASVDVLSMPKVSVKGGRFSYSTPYDNTSMLEISYALNPVVDSEFVGMSDYGLRITSCQGGTVTGLFMDALSAGTGYGVSFTDATQDASCIGAKFINCRHALSTNNQGAQYGIPRRITFALNNVSSSAPAQSGSGGDAIDTHAASEDIYILDNVVQGSSSAGINVEGRSAYIRGNQIDNCLNRGITVHNETDRRGQYQITDNVITNCADDGINCYSGVDGGQLNISSVTIDRNTTINCGTEGIHVGSGNGVVQSVKIRQNIITTTSTSSGAVAYPAIRVTNAGTVIITDNDITSAEDGITVVSNTRTQIAGNILTTIADKAILASTNNCEVTRNTIDGALTGIYFDTSYTNVVEFANDITATTHRRVDPISTVAQYMEMSDVVTLGSSVSEVLVRGPQMVLGQAMTGVATLTNVADDCDRVIVKGGNYTVTLVSGGNIYGAQPSINLTTSTDYVVLNRVNADWYVVAVSN